MRNLKTTRLLWNNLSQYKQIELILTCTNVTIFFRTISEKATMDSNKTDLLDQVRDKIIELVDLPDILTALRKYNILDHKDQEKVCRVSDTTQRKNYEVIFELVKSRGDRAFWIFCHSVENKAPGIYRNLHNNPNVNARDNCAICNEEYGDFKCQYCLGKSLLK